MSKKKKSCVLQKLPYIPLTRKPAGGQALFGNRVEFGFVTIHHHFPKKLTSKYSNFFYYYSNKKITTK
jgi:hypothetical protein